MTTIELSVIIPVYNALPYFKKCIASILSQDCDSSRYEVILIDDGSTDGSAALCDDLARSYGNYFVIHQDNSGECARPRNVGLDRARGEYVFFCDADDSFYPHAFKNMLDHAVSSGCDIGLFKINGSEWGNTYLGLFDKDRSHCDFDNAPLHYFFGSYRLIKRSLLLDNGIRYVEGTSPEDWAFSLECYLNARNVCVFADQDYYRYRKRSDGLSLSMGGLSSLTEDWHTMFGGLQAYVQVAERYHVLRRYPIIMLRPSLAIAGLVQKGKSMPKEAFTAYRALIRPHYTEAVRSLLPFSVLIANDMLVDGMPPWKLRLLSGYGNRISFSRDAKESCDVYEIRDDGGLSYSRSMPRMIGPNLANPQYAFAKLTCAFFLGSYLELSGRAFLLRSRVTSIEHVSLHAVPESGGEPLCFEVSLRSAIMKPAYGDVSSCNLEWDAVLPVEAFASPQHIEGASNRYSMYLKAKFVEGKRASIRLGRYRVCGVAEVFLSGSMSNGQTVVTPLIAPDGYFVLADGRV